MFPVNGCGRDRLYALCLALENVEPQPLRFPVQMFPKTDMGGQLNLCLMAAEMFPAPLETSLSFPQVTTSADFMAFRWAL